MHLLFVFVVHKITFWADGSPSGRLELKQQREPAPPRSSNWRVTPDSQLEGCDPGTGRLRKTTHHYNKTQKKGKLDQEGATGAGGMNREEAPGKSPEEMYVQQKVRVLLMLKKMGSNVRIPIYCISSIDIWCIINFKGLVVINN
ncbi:unnamed protein product [Oncorhynchus mykiss]|uniref:Beta-catenin-interacting ICAT domain-containing protein n=1 Tax=Oncorhynchus mykiss TaxID=8022 RepID=A0A060YKC4_ONCMY|nr:unnamed protein product [Oncorhynchus mykiss]